MHRHLREYYRNAIARLSTIPSQAEKATRQAASPYESRYSSRSSSLKLATYSSMVMV